MARLLIADNSPFYRRLLSDSLGEDGHQVTAVGDGSEALATLDDDGPFDAVVLDLVMPKLDGGRACRQIKQDPATCDTPVVILSGLRQDEIDEWDQIGADAFVAKMQAEPMLGHLREVLEELLAGELLSPIRGFDAMHRREVVSELLEERRAQRTLLGSLSEGFLRLSEGDRIVEANPAATVMLERPETALVNRPVREILGCDVPALARLFSPPHGDGFRLPCGDRVLEVRGLSGGRDDDRFVLLFDATEEVRVARRQRDLEARIESSERVSALGDIVAGVAHELKNPLTAILGYAELLLQFCADERTRDRLEKLDREANRCRKLVDNLLCFARKRQAYRRPHDLNKAVSTALEARQEAILAADVEVQTRLADDLPLAAIDYGQIEQVLMNLLDNSVRALSGVRAGDRRIEICTRAAADCVVLEVRDSGPGVPAGNRERVFEPFFTTHRHEGGAGLGLAVSFGIVQEHGGRIAVLDGAPGAVLRVELPLAAPTALAAPAAGDGAPAILVVDREPVVAGLLEDVLTDSGFRVERAGNGAQALDRVTEVAFDAVLIDVKMADLDGRHLFEAIRERCPALASRVVFTASAPDSPSVMQLVRDTGATLLAKPFRVEEVAQTCREVTARAEPTDPAD